MKRGLVIRFSATSEFSEVNYALKRAIRVAAEKTLDFESFPYDAEISVTLTNNAYIRKLNKKYREKDKHTDVLSFPMYEGGNFIMSECISGEMLGDIVISLERAAEQAKEIGHSFLHEIAFLTVHSMLHLLGYDHEISPEEEEKQCSAQREIFKMLDI